MNCQVKRRNGIIENLDVNKIKQVTEYACQGISECSATELEMDSKLQFPPLITTKEIQAILIQTAIEKVISKKDGVPIIQANWSYVAARLLLYDLYKESKLNRGISDATPAYSNFYGLIKTLSEQGLYGTYLLENYSKDEIDELEQYIVADRDFLFNYDGLHLLNSRYLVKDYDGNAMELPQERFMVIAMHLAIPEKSNRLSFVKQFYDIMSKLQITVATSTLSNAGRKDYQLSSCFISVAGDSLLSIYDANTTFAQVSKGGGALGLYLGKVRAKNSSIKGIKGASGGVIPWIKLYNDTAVAVDQLGRRKGSCCVTLDVWHKDIFDFLDLKTNNGDDRRKAHDLFLSVSIPDIFMKILKDRGEWCLFDPYEVKQVMGYSLEDCFDNVDNLEFSKKYNECVNNERLHRITVPSLDLMKKILRSAVETGTPFIFFRDTVNRDNPNKHAGMIYCSNLCHEIAQNTSENEYIEYIVDEENGITTQTIKSGDNVTCNLSSINLGKVSLNDIKDIIPLQIRMLDNVVTLNAFPTGETKITANKYRAIGLGTSGYHQHLVNNNIKWESQDHLDLAKVLYEEIAYWSIKTSMELSKERGSYPVFKGSEWDSGMYFERNKLDSERWVQLKNDVNKFGMRNGYLIAIAPTGSTSNIANTSAGIDPIFQKYFVEEKKGMYIPKTAPDLNDSNLWLYKEAHTINQQWSIDACATRQQFIDQTQSFNMYITPEMPVIEIYNLYVSCWEKGVKTIYYIRNKSLEVDECTSCAS